MSRISSESDLESALSEPTQEAIDTMSRLRGDVMLLGVGGKMGLSLARMVKRASDAAGVRRRVIGVSRFSSTDESTFNSNGIETFRCDLLDETELARLPSTANIIFMTGQKFGTTGNEAATWAMNCFLPGIVCHRFKNSRVVAFSTGNTYGLTPVARGGSVETDEPVPVGEYAMSALGRERTIDYFSRALQIPAVLIRLNYACDLRYGVLVDLARLVWEEQPVNVSMGYFNTIWQGDANAVTLRAFAHVTTPPFVLNVTGPELLSVRAVCEQFGQLMQKQVRFTGVESDTALLSNAGLSLTLFGPPRVAADELIDWVAHWVMQGGRSLGKPTHFESRSGRF